MTTPTDAAQAPSAAEVAEALAERDRALIDSDRLLMQMVQTSLSLIGFGFTINAFFSDAAQGGIVNADATARRLGLSLLSLGLVFLALGIWNQARLRLSIRGRYKAILAFSPTRGYSAAPSFLLAIMLLIAGLVALGSIVLKMLP